MPWDMLAELYEASKLVLMTALGCVLLYVYSDVRDFNHSRAFVKKMFPTRGDAFHNRTDFLCAVVFGTIVGTVVFLPQHGVEALAAGLGWVGGMNTVTKQKDK